MHRRSYKVKGLTLIEALIYLLISSIVLGILLSAFIGSKRVMETMRRQQSKTDFLWRISALYDYLEGSVTNLLTPLKRLYKEDNKTYILVVSPYDNPYSALDSAPDGFYAGECPNGHLSLAKISAGTKESIEGNCSAASYYRLGHSGIPAFALLKIDGENRVMEEGVGTEIYPTSLGTGNFAIIMKKKDGTETNDPRDAAYLSVRFMPENLEVTSWEEM